MGAISLELFKTCSTGNEAMSLGKRGMVKIVREGGEGRGEGVGKELESEGKVYMPSHCKTLPDIVNPIINKV